MTVNVQTLPSSATYFEVQPKSNSRLTPQWNIRPDEFVVKTCDPMLEMSRGKFLDDWHNGKNENELVNILLQEYESIKPEDFATYEEFQQAKDIAYKRVTEAINNATKNSNDRNENNSNCFSKVMNALGNFFKDAGDMILTFIEKHFISTAS